MIIIEKIKSQKLGEFERIRIELSSQLGTPLEYLGCNRSHYYYASLIGPSKTSKKEKVEMINKLGGYYKETPFGENENVIIIKGGVVIYYDGRVYDTTGGYCIDAIISYFELKEENYIIAYYQSTYYNALTVMKKALERVGGDYREFYVDEED